MMSEERRREEEEEEEEEEFSCLFPPFQTVQRDAKRPNYFERRG